jgi:uroporphyrinogen decarboxylase
MTDREWMDLLAFLKGLPSQRTPAGLIVDSPWIHGYCQVDTVDYYDDQELWLSCQDQLRSDFPGLLFLPGDWVEFGMASEPSSFGCSVHFYRDQTVGIGHLITSADDLDVLDDLKVPDPTRDGLMPLVLSKLRRLRGPLLERGRRIRIIAARGPLNVAGFLMSIPELCVAVKTDPVRVHRLLDKTTELVIRWLEAQAEAVGEIGGILLLDDICGFFSEEEYLEFAHPRLKRIFEHFSVPVKMFHNDNFGNRYTTFPHIADLGVNLFNYSYQADLCEAWKQLGPNVAILGSLPPLDLLTRGDPAGITQATRELLSAKPEGCRLMLSAGGGASPGMPKENLLAMLQALEDSRSDG